MSSKKLVESKVLPEQEIYRIIQTYAPAHIKSMSKIDLLKEAFNDHYWLLQEGFKTVINTRELAFAILTRYDHPKTNIDASILYHANTDVTVYREGCKYRKNNGSSQARL